MNKQPRDFSEDYVDGSSHLYRKIFGISTYDIFHVCKNETELLTEQGWVNSSTLDGYQNTDFDWYPGMNSPQGQLEEFRQIVFHISRKQKKEIVQKETLKKLLQNYYRITTKLLQPNPYRIYIRAFVVVVVPIFLARTRVRAHANIRARARTREEYKKNRIKITTNAETLIEYGLRRNFFVVIL